VNWRKLPEPKTTERDGVKQAKIAPRPRAFIESCGGSEKFALYYVIMTESEDAPQEGERERNTEIFGKQRSLGTQFGIVFGSIVGNGD